MTKTGDASELVKVQKALFSQMKTAGANVDKPETTIQRTENYYSTRINTFNKWWQQFNENHIKIFQIEKGGEDYLNGELFQETEELYTNYLTILKDGLAKCSNTLTNLKNNSNSEFNTSKIEVQLPRISVPKFDGNYRTWASFRDLFKSMIHDNTSLSKVQKLHYLKTSVTGEAEFSLRQFDISETNYELAWEFLERRYNNKRFQVNAHLKVLFDYPIIKSESATMIKNLNDQCIEVLHQLKTLGIATKNWDAILLYILIQKLPFETQKLWEQEQGGNSNVPAFVDFTNFLENRFRTLESLQKLSTNKIRHSTHTTKKTNTFLNNTSRCASCQENHSLEKCPRFLKMSTQQRNTLVSTQKICKNCLASKSHNIFDCPNKNECKKCQRRHHSLLHINYIHRERGLKDSTIESLADSQIKSTMDTNKHTQSLFSYVKRALLATALVNVSDAFGCKHTLRAIIDSGSQASFITKAASKRLQLKNEPADIQISGLSKTKTAHASSQINLKIASMCTPFEPEINALIINKITGSVQDQKEDITRLK